MGDESEPITAVAKAVEETTKTGRALIEAGSDLARFAGKALGTVPEDTIGLLGGDHLHDLRIRNLDKIARKTEEILRTRGVEDLESIGPRALLLALEAASQETDETLQDNWANLLANAMDPNKDTSLQRVFIETLREFEPIDALLLQWTGELSSEMKPSGLPGMAVKGLSGAYFDLRETQFELSAGRLHKLHCIKPSGSLVGDAIDAEFLISALGMELYLACKPDAPD